LPSVIAIMLILTCVSAVSSYFSSRNVLLCIVPLLGSTVFFAVFKKFSTQWKDDVFFQLVIGLVGLSLLLSSTLISNDLLGWDVHQEFNLSLQVLRSGMWHPEVEAQYNSVVSITILPAAISLVSHINPIWVFKIVFPALFSLVPMVLYRFYRSVLNPEGSFLAAFLFMSYPTFYLELISLARQEIGTILLALVLLAFSYRSIGKGTSGMILILVLTVGIVMAHYSIAYIYLVLLVVSFIVSGITRRSRSLVSPFILLAAVVITFYWYVFFASPFELISLGQLFSWLVNGLVYDFFNPFSRPAILSMALGQYRLGFLGDLNRSLYFAVNLTMALGFLIFASRRKKMAAERGIFPLLVLAFLFLGLSVVLPYFAASLDIQRIYLLVLMLASPCFIFGAEAYSRVIRRAGLLLHAGLGVRRGSVQFKWVPAAALLLCYFMFTSGWVWAVTMGAPSSFLLDSKRMAASPNPSLEAYYFSYYTAPQDIAGARWLKQHLVSERVVCADWNSRLNVLTSYGELTRGLSSGPLLPSDCHFQKSYVYLSLLNTLYGIGTQGNWPVSQLPLETLNRVYTDGSTIYT